MPGQSEPRETRNLAVVCIHLICNYGIIIRVYDHHYVLEVLRRRANHRRPADVYVLDCFFNRNIFAGYGLAKRVEVHDDHINVFDFVLFDLLLMLRACANGEKPAVNFRMKRLHTPAEYFRKACER